MVIHYPPGQLRYNSDQPTAVTGVLVATSGSSHSGEIPLGIPTCSARSRQGRWALYPNGTEVIVVWPGGAMVGPAVEVAGELERLGGDRHDELDRGAASAVRRFLTDPAAEDGARWSATRARTWSSPAVGYWLSGPANQPGHQAGPSAGWPAHPMRPPQPPTTLPDPQPETPPARAA
jgi:hypothetical protein